jgi:hypothetical protein
MPIKKTFLKSKDKEKTCVCKRVKRKSCNSNSLAAIPTATRAAMKVGELSRVDVIVLLHVFILYHFSISNKIDLSRGCRRFVEPR